MQYLAARILRQNTQSVCNSMIQFGNIFYRVFTQHVHINLDQSADCLLGENILPFKERVGFRIAFAMPSFGDVRHVLVQFDSLQALCY